jgi:uncharacterized protein YjdB
MTFKHKLAKRLAIIWGVAALACTPGDMAVSPDAPRMAVSASQILLQESFEDNAFSGRGWYDNTAMATTTAEHIPGSTRALEAHFLSGATTPTWGGAARHLFASTPTLYVSYWVKYSSNWVGSGRAYHPHEFLVMSDQDGDWDGLSNGWLVAYIENNYQNGGIPRVQLQDNKAINTGSGALPVNLVTATENRSVSGCNGVVEANVVTTCFNMPPWYNDKEISAGRVWFQPNPGPGYKGDWNHVEAYLQLNSVVGGIGMADGVIQYWFNGSPVIDRHDILFRTGARPNLMFHQFVIAPYIGDGSPNDQSMWVDDLTLATSRPDSAPPPPPASDSVASVTVSPSATSIAAGSTAQLAATPQDVSGTALTGHAVTWTSSNNAVATVSDSGLVTAIAAGSATVTATSDGNSGTATITVTAPVITAPGKVSDLAVAAVTTNSATLSFTEVTGGTGLPASYLVRFARVLRSWHSATEVALGTCKAPVAGTAIGATRTCTVTGLAASTGYQFQLVAFRGTLDVNAVFGARSNVASGATVATAPTPVATVAVSPANASLALGETQIFAATLKDSTGNTLTGRPVTWASSNTGIATVSDNGLVTAVAVGSATVTATSEGSSGTTTITVSVVAPPPPPTGGSWPNEPAGFTVLTDEPFDALVENGWRQVQRQATNGSGLFLTADATAPLSASSVLEFKYAPGYTGGSEPGVEYYNPGTPVKETYFSFWWKPSSPWQNHGGSGVNKLAFLFPSAGCIYIMMYGEGGSFTMQVEPEFGGDVRRLAPNRTATPVVLGQWHRIEWYVKYSSSDSSRDGVTRWWLDGVLQGEYQDLLMPGDAGFSEYQLAPTWGGIDGSKTETDYYRYDHARISKR